MKCTSSSRVCCEQNESFRIRLLYPISDLFSPLSLLPGQPTLFFPPPIQFLPFSHGPTRIFQSPIILFVIRVKNPRPLRDLHDLTRTNSRARTKIGTGRDWYQPGNGYGCWFERSRGDNRSGGNGKMTYCLKVLLRYRDLFVRGGGRGGRVADDVRRGGREAALWATRRCRWKMVWEGERE